MENQIPQRTKNRRFREAMELQQRIAAEIAKEQVGKEITVLTESAQVARSAYDAPDVDARVLLTTPAPVGAFIKAHVVDTQTYDLVADPLLG